MAAKKSSVRKYRCFFLNRKEIWFHFVLISIVAVIFKSKDSLSMCRGTRIASFRQNHMLYKSNFNSNQLERKLISSKTIKILSDLQNGFPASITDLHVLKMLAVATEPGLFPFTKARTLAAFCIIVWLEPNHGLQHGFPKCWKSVLYRIFRTQNKLSVAQFIATHSQIFSVCSTKKLSDYRVINHIE